jgi:hypothetical protein
VCKGEGKKLMEFCEKSGLEMLKENMVRILRVSTLL